MHLLYESDSFTVVRFDVTAAVAPGAEAPKPAPSARLEDRPLSHGAYEIVDNVAGKEIFLQGLMAEHFEEGVEALIETQPSEEEMDDFIARFSSLMHQSVVLH